MVCTHNAKHTTYLLVLCEMINEQTFDILRSKKIHFFLLSLEKIKFDFNFYFSGYHISSHAQCLRGVDHFVIQLTSSEFICRLSKWIFGKFLCQYF